MRYHLILLGRIISENNKFALNKFSLCSNFGFFNTGHSTGGQPAWARKWEVHQFKSLRVQKVSNPDPRLRNAFRSTLKLVTSFAAFDQTWSKKLELSFEFFDADAAGHLILVLERKNDYLILFPCFIEFQFLLTNDLCTRIFTSFWLIAS